MHARSPDKPSQAQLILPLLDTIASMGGKATPKAAAAALANRFRLDPVTTDAVTISADGRPTNVWRRHVRYAAQKAKQLGYLPENSPGLWQLADEAADGLRSASARIVVIVTHDEAGQPVAAQIDIAATLPSIHTVRLGDARDLSWIDDNQIALAVTSPPYFDLKHYGHAPGQLATFDAYQDFLSALAPTWRELFRVLQPGGRLACNVGDVMRSRKQHSTHHVLPLHADILVQARDIGFLPLTGILWQKIAHCGYEQGRGGILGRPGQPNGVIRSEIEHVLLLKKPGPYRTPTKAQQAASQISPDEYQTWHRPIWSDVAGARATADHPAPFPITIPYRLIRMFSFTGDTVLDPFGGTLATAKAAMAAGRNSVSVEVEPAYYEAGVAALQTHARQVAQGPFTAP